MSQHRCRRQPGRGLVPGFLSLTSCKTWKQNFPL
jgi:hypothetical protein